MTVLKTIFPPHFSNMPRRTIPDGLLHDILSACLTISPELFFRFPTQVPRTSRTSRNTQLLRVSKQWLRVGRPLLYSSLTLSEAARTKEVAFVLKHDPRLGRSIRYLRLEGGYCKELLTIVELASSIEGLYVNLEIESSDSIVGLRKSLHILKPRVLYLHQLNLAGLRRQNKNITESREILESMISEHWAALKRVYLSDAFPISATMAAALQNAPAAEEFSICTSDLKVWLSSSATAAYVQTLMQNPHLGAVKCRGRLAQKSVCNLLQDIPGLWVTSALLIFVD
ncbi:hypothetical protein PHLGIDRAFT_354460 [Phlebiopsis gigantea 11061_1 CR5-6]|uniref:F-box domain-containing protein n=1 Tax=Phlebiopsis gigantea (strain 11061_1 CR5-6) TaxID=745531 RepID=A0A0C3NUE4_PHLG1|nr:hypothetical protein PHLGIDRAFT_354460 [Phlebiopsis gigantea 11061_1 CR5-6]